MDDNFDPGHPLYRELKALARLTRRHPALRDGAQQHRFSSSSAGVYAFSRIQRSKRREYVVALNNAGVPASASIPTFVRNSGWKRVYGSGPRRLHSGSDKRLKVTLDPLSAVVYRAKERIPKSHSAPPISLDVPAEGRDRLEVKANVSGDSFYEVTFLAKVGNGGWKDIGTDDNAPYRVLQDVADVAPGTPIRYRAIVLDNSGHTRSSGERSTKVAPPAITIEAPLEGQGVRGRVSVRATTVPEHANYVMTFERSVDGGAFAPVDTDDSSPVYTGFDDTSSLPDGASVRYRAVLTYAPGKTVTSAPRAVHIQQSQVTTAVIHYNGSATQWGLHLFGDGLAPGEATAEWTAATPFEGSNAYGVLHEIAIADDTKRVGFIVHGFPPNQDTKDTPNDRFFSPLATPEIWLKQGDARIYSCAAANDTCVVPSA
jgi:hypothetical protein